MNFQLAVLFGALTLMSLIIALVIGIMIPSSKKNMLKYHKAIAIITMILVVLHISAVLM